MIPPRNLPFYGRPQCRDTYRYWLHRELGEDKGKVLFIMLNPSDALSLGSPDAPDDNDQTVTRCIDFARSWGYGDLTVVNLFAYRSREPDELLCRPNESIGPHNDAAICWAIQSIRDAEGYVVCAWGNNYCTLWCRNCYVLQTLRDLDIQGNCLGMTKKGHPKHPLYVKATTKLASLPLWTYPASS